MTGVLIGTLLLVLPACTSAPVDGMTPAEAACAAVVDDALGGFVSAMAAADATLAASYFASSSFGAFSEAPSRFEPEASNRDTLQAYLARRIDEGARFELVAVEYNGISGSNLGNFGLRLRDENGDDVVGKGAIDCGGNGIIYFGLGTPQQ